MSKNNLFNYSEIKDDPTKEEVLKEESFFGYNSTKPLTFDSSYIDLYNSIIDDNVILTSDRFLDCDASKKIIKSSISIWDNLGIKLHEIYTLDSSYGKVPDGGFVITQEFLDAIKMIHPSNVPITFNKKETGKLYGYTNTLEMRAPSNKPEDNIVLCCNIDLSKVGNKITPCIYNHEIAHTQLNSVGSCEKLLDAETIPILIEEIFANKMDNSLNTLEKLRNIRLLSIFRCLYTYTTYSNMAYVSRIEYDAYIKSGLQAIWLDNIYLTGNSNIQKEMQKYINRIFSGQVSVQDMLNHYDANLEDVPKCLKKLEVPR